MTDWHLVTTTWATDWKNLLAVRTEVFVVEQGVPVDLEIDGPDQFATHVLARSQSGQTVATGRLLDNGHIGRMAVLAHWRHRGIGSAILQRLIDLACARGHDRVFLNAQCCAVSFYERVGFVPEGGIFLDAGISHRHMYLNLRRIQDLN